jgi:hypothetical protein
MTIRYGIYFTFEDALIVYAFLKLDKCVYGQKNHLAINAKPIAIIRR